MNILLCVGCNSYAKLPTLQGAEKDAAAVFQLLLAGGKYSRSSSRLVLSPKCQALSEALNDSFPPNEGIGTFTFFFAGHGAVSGGSFYLCTSESSFGRLSTTGFPISSLFLTLGEFRPREANIIVDACNAGASSYDLNNLIKPEIIGSSTALSVAFLGACAADQSASESARGGVLTTALVKCLTGEVEVQRTSPNLDLIETGVVVSELMRSRNSRQSVMMWGLSLFGRAMFAPNPIFGSSDVHGSFPIRTISPGSDLAETMRRHSSDLWEAYRHLKDDWNPREMLNLLDKIRMNCGDPASLVTVLEGLSETMGLRGSESSDLLTVSQLLSTCAVSLLPETSDPLVVSFLRTLFSKIRKEDARVRAALAQSLDQEGVHSLVSSAGVMADVYYLPLRISNLLGWLGATIIHSQLFPSVGEQEASECFALAKRIFERYGDSSVAVSDAQAAPLYIFLQACFSAGQRGLGKAVADRYFLSFVEREGNVTRCHTDGATALRYILSLSETPFRPEDWRPANPSFLLSVLLLMGGRLGSEDDWDLRSLDRQSLAFFLPANWTDFGQSTIEIGQNITHRLGFGVWTISQYLREFDKALPLEWVSEGIARKECAVCCMVSSLLFPDRVAFVLEYVTPSPRCSD